MLHAPYFCKVSEDESIFRGKLSTLDAWCCVFLIVRAASSGDNVQIAWQAWRIVVRVSFCEAGAAIGADLSCVQCHFAWQEQFLG